MTLNFLLTSDWSEKCMSFEERTGTSKLFFLPLAHYMVFRLADTLHLENSSLWPLKRKKSEVSRRGGSELRHVSDLMICNVFFDLWARRFC